MENKENEIWIKTEDGVLMLKKVAKNLVKKEKLRKEKAEKAAKKEAEKPIEKPKGGK